MISTSSRVTIKVGFGVTILPSLNPIPCTMLWILYHHRKEHYSGMTQCFFKMYHILIPKIPISRCIHTHTYPISYVTFRIVVYWQAYIAFASVSVCSYGSCFWRYPGWDWILYDPKQGTGMKKWWMYRGGRERHWKRTLVVGLQDDVRTSLGSSLHSMSWCWLPSFMSLPHVFPSSQ